MPGTLYTVPDYPIICFLIEYHHSGEYGCHMLHNTSSNRWWFNEEDMTITLEGVDRFKDIIILYPEHSTGVALVQAGSASY